MKVEKFKIIQFVRELIVMIDNNMDNFPKKDIELKKRIRSNSFDILELVYEANTSSTGDNILFFGIILVVAVIGITIINKLEKRCKIKQ